MRFFPTFIIPVLLLIVLSGCSQDESDYKSDVPVSEPSRVNESAEESEPTEEDEPTDNISEIPSEINLDIPFYSQAPFGNWDMPYQDACEEASLLLAYYYATDQTVTAEEFDEALLAMVDWQVDYFGSYKDTTIEQTAEIASEYLGYQNWEVVEDPTVEELKTYLSKGYPIVAPFAGRYLGNPYFTGEGPVYHMLVIRGYDDTYFITNDVGTRRGENFIYTYDVLMNALHDWDVSAIADDEGILNGSKKVLVLKD